MAFSLNASRLVLAAYSDPGRLRWLFFFVVLLMHVLVLVSNLLLIAVILLNRSLHHPMYVFLCSLFINELHGGCSIFPFLLVELLKDQHSISHTLCFVQIFSVYTYANVEILTLAAMSYDRYMAICQPLHYHRRLSPQRAFGLVSGVWLFVLAEVTCMVSLSAPLSLCGNQISKVYCDNYSVVKLACGDTTVNNVYGLLYTVLVLFYVPGVILYTYIRIIAVCMRGSQQMRQKAVSTCLPHLASLLNLACASFFEIIQSRFNMNYLHIHVRVFLSLYFLLCPPLFNPLMYGFNLSGIRTGLRRLLHVRV